MDIRISKEKIKLRLTLKEADSLLKNYALEEVLVLDQKNRFYYKVELNKDQEASPVSLISRGARFYVNKNELESLLYKIKSNTKIKKQEAQIFLSNRAVLEIDVFSLNKT